MIYPECERCLYSSDRCTFIHIAEKTLQISKETTACEPRNRSNLEFIRHYKTGDDCCHYALFLDLHESSLTFTNHGSSASEDPNASSCRSISSQTPGSVRSIQAEIFERLFCRIGVGRAHASTNHVQNVDTKGLTTQ